MAVAYFVLPNKPLCDGRGLDARGDCFERGFFPELEEGTIGEDKASAEGGGGTEERRK